MVEKADEPAVSRMLPVMDETTESFTEYEYADDCADRRAESAVSFARDNRGFTATISLAEDNLVFFSVPYEDGWSATVNGEKAAIYKVNVGLHARGLSGWQDIVIVSTT